MSIRYRIIAKNRDFTDSETYSSFVLSCQIPQELYRITQHISWVHQNLLAVTAPEISATSE